MMNCQECFEDMELRYNVEFPNDFIIYICPKCGHNQKFSKDDILILLLESIKKKC